MIEKLLTRTLRRELTAGSLSVTFPSGARETFGDGSCPHVEMHILDPGALRRIAFDPGMGTAEMYIDGRLVLTAGDIYDLILMAKRNGSTVQFGAIDRLRHIWRRLRDNPYFKAITPGRARANVAHHYDLDERLYRLFLDTDMQYSCAWFERPSLTLDAAQLAKKRLIAAKLCLRPDAHVLDIGCGWGGMALYLARVCGARVTGVTLSEEQLRVAQQRARDAGLEDRVEFRLQDYRQISETFDNVVSVGMFEHVGARQYPAFFGAAARLLRPHGVMLLHSMSQRRPEPYNHPFIEKYIFPGGYIPALSEVLPAVETARLLLRDTEILSLHYAETVKHWRRRFLDQREAVLELYDERFIRMWDLYLAGSEATFRHDAVHVFHLQLAHNQACVPLTRAYIPEAMTRLREAEARHPDYAAIQDARRTFAMQA